MLQWRAFALNWYMDIPRRVCACIKDRSLALSGHLSIRGEWVSEVNMRQARIRLPVVDAHMNFAFVSSSMRQ
jgi:hypothetical protein